MAKQREVLESHTILETKPFNVVEERIRLATGVITNHLSVFHPGAVVILPRASSNEFLYIRQYRHSIREELFEFPAGTLGKGEDPANCASRELSEETGFAAKRWEKLGTLYPAPGFCNEKQHLFLASDLYPHRLPGDEDEEIEVLTGTVEEIESLIKSGKMCDGKSISIFMKARLLGMF